MSEPDYGKIVWKSSLKGLDRWSYSLPSSDLTFESFMEYSKLKQPPEGLLYSFNTLIETRENIQSAIKEAINSLASQSFLAAFLIWIKEVLSMTPATAILEGAKVLLELDLIGTRDEKGDIWTLEKARGFDHSVILDAIRCNRDLPINLREHLVDVYGYFMMWLHKETHGYINKLEDPDYKQTSGRKMSFLSFIEFLMALEGKEKELLAAKLLYFGGDCTVEEVLDVQLENIDFEAKTIKYKSKAVSYPAHIFVDIKALVQKRKKGHLFLGRQEAPLNRVTIFRNFKEAALKAGLGGSFSPKSLSERISLLGQVHSMGFSLISSN